MKNLILARWFWKTLVIYVVLELTGANTPSYVAPINDFSYVTKGCLRAHLPPPTPFSIYNKTNLIFCSEERKKVLKFNWRQNEREKKLIFFIFFSILNGS